MTHRQMSPDVKDRMLPLNLSSWHESCRLNERNTCLNSSVTGMSRLSKGQSARKAFKSGAGYLWQQPLGTNILTHPRTSKSKTWTRPVPTQSPTQVTQVVATVRSSTSSSPPEQLNAKVVAQRSQQLQLSDRTPGQAVEGNIRVLQSPNPETRRLIHKGRYKLVQPKPQAGLGQQQPSLQHRKRALSGSFSATSQVAKRRNTWVRSTSKAKGPPALVTNSKPFTSIFVRSSHTRKLQLIRKLSASSAGPLTRRWSKSPSLARSLPSARYLSGARRPALGLKTPGVVKPGKLQRIGGVLYKVGGSGFNRSLRRQSTPQTLRNDATPQVCLQFGCSLVQFGYLGPVHMSCLLWKPWE